MSLDTTDYLKSIKAMRSIVIITIVSALIVCAFFGFMYIKMANDKEDRIYIVTDAGTFMAKRNEYGLRYDFELKNHVRLFFQNLMEGDQYTYNKNVDQALCLIDNESGKRIYDQLQRGGFFELYRKENAHSRVTFDSIKVDMNSRPMRAKVYFKQGIYWAGYSKDFPYAAVMEVVEDNRSDKNPFGLMITKFSFLEYKVETNIVTPQDSIVR